MLNSEHFCILYPHEFSYKNSHLSRKHNKYSPFKKIYLLYPCSVTTVTDLIFSLAREKWWTKMPCFAES